MSSIDEYENKDQIKDTIKTIFSNLFDCAVDDPKKLKHSVSKVMTEMMVLTDQLNFKVSDLLEESDFIDQSKMITSLGASLAYDLENMLSDDYLDPSEYKKYRSLMTELNRIVHNKFEQDNSRPLMRTR